jgi:alpha-tubulin suppressor-like RCC1 family protein
MQRYFKISALTACVLLAGCSGTSSSGKSDSNGGAVEKPQTSTKEVISLSQMSTIPMVGGKSKLATILVNSTFGSQLSLIGSEIIGDSRIGKINIDDKQCRIMQAYGSCPVTFMVPYGTGTSRLRLKFKDIHGVIHELNTVVSYEKSDSALNEIYFNATNNKFVLNPGSRGRYIIPIVLGADFEDGSIKAFSSTAYAKPSVVCQSYKKHGQCDVTVTLEGKEATSYRGHLTISGTKKLSGNQRSKSANNVASINIPFFTNVMDGQGNLLTNEALTIINPSDGTHSEKIILVNQGTGNATNVKVTAGDPAVVTITPLGACASDGTIPANGSCEYNVTANSLTYNIDEVAISYHDSINAATHTAKVAYYPKALQETISMSENAADHLVLTPADGSGRTTTIHVKNEGDRNVSNIHFALSGAPAGASIDRVNSTCHDDMTLGKHSTSGCDLAVKYVPTSEDTTLRSFHVKAEGKYTNIEGDSSTSLHAIAVNYSSTDTTVALLKLTGNTHVTAAIDEPKSVELLLENEGRSTILDSADFEEIAGVFVHKNATDADACKVGQEVSVGKPCKITYELNSPTTLDQEVAMHFEYKKDQQSNVAGNVVTLSPKFNVAVHGSASITDPDVKPGDSGQIPGGGDGKNTPYQFVNVENQLILEFTYKNSGDGKASQFNVLNDLPIGYEIDASSDCGFGDNVGVVLDAAGKGKDSCVLKVKAVDSRLLHAGNILGSMNITAPGYSYVDTSGELIKVSAKSSSTTQVTALPYADYGISHEVQGEVLKLKFTVNSLDQISGAVTFKVLSDPNLQGFTPVSGDGTCPAAAGASCEVELNIPAYADKTKTYDFKIERTAAGAYPHYEQYSADLSVGGSNPAPIPPSGKKLTQVTRSSTHACVLTEDDKAYCWGDNTNGELGLGNRTALSEPTAAVTGTYKKVVAGRGFTAAIGMDGKVYTWGSNSNGQLGVGKTPTLPTGDTLVDSDAPLEVLNVSGVIDVEINENTVCAVYGTWNSPNKPTTNIACWGQQAGGLLGNSNNTYTSVATPVGVGRQSGDKHTYTKIGTAGLGSVMCAVASDNTADCWGGTSENLFPGQEYKSANFGLKPSTQVVTPSGVHFTDFFGSQANNCSIGSDTKLYCWGGDYQGMLTSDSYTPQEITGLPKFTSLTSGMAFAFCGLTNSGEIYCWGDNQHGEVSHAATGVIKAENAVELNVPEVKFTAISDSGSANSTFYSCAIADETKLYCWGSNDSAHIVPDAAKDHPVSIDLKNINK